MAITPGKLIQTRPKPWQLYLALSMGFHLLLFGLGISLLPKQVKQSTITITFQLEQLDLHNNTPVKQTTVPSPPSPPPQTERPKAMAIQSAPRPVAPVSHERDASIRKTPAEARSKAQSTFQATTTNTSVISTPPHDAETTPTTPNAAKPEATASSSAITTTQDIQTKKTELAAATPAAPKIAATHASSSEKAQWQRQLLKRLTQFQRYPKTARAQQQEGITHLRFSINRAGKVLSASIQQSSGVSALDEEALALIYRAMPLPAPPADLPGETLELVIPIRFSLKR